MWVHLIQSGQTSCQARINWAVDVQLFFFIFLRALIILNQTIQPLPLYQHSIHQYSSYFDNFYKEQTQNMKAQSEKQSQNNKIITLVRLGASKLQFTIPLNWSVNKFKCLLTSQIPALNFDEFELCHNGNLVGGTHKLLELAREKPAGQKLQVEIIKAKSQIKLNEYYKKSIGTFMQISKYNSQPVLSVDYQKYRNLAYPEGRQTTQNENENNEIDLNQIPDNDPAANNANAANFLFRALRLLGMYLLLILIYDHGKAYQIAIIASLILLYFTIQYYVKYKQRKLQNARARPANNQNANANNNNNDNENNGGAAPSEQQSVVRDKQSNEEGVANKQASWREGLATIYMYKTIQVIFCFLFTFFPNLSIDMHLQINRERLEKARENVNRLMPNSYPKELQANNAN